MPKGTSTNNKKRVESRSEAKSLRIRTPGQTGGGFRIMKAQALTVKGVRRAKQTTPEGALKKTNTSDPNIHNVNRNHKTSKIKKGSFRDYDTYAASKTFHKVNSALGGKKKWDAIRSRPGGHSTRKKSR